MIVTHSSPVMVVAVSGESRILNSAIEIGSRGRTLKQNSNSVAYLIRLFLHKNAYRNVKELAGHGRNQGTIKGFIPPNLPCIVPQTDRTAKV